MEMGNCWTAAPDETGDFQAHPVRRREDISHDAKTQVGTEQGPHKMIIEMYSNETIKSNGSCGKDDFRNSLTPVMRPVDPGAKGARNHKTNKPKTTRETIHEASESSGHRENKKSRRVQRPTLENLNQTAQDAGEPNACEHKHQKTREMTSSMEDLPEEEASLCSGPSQPHPAGITVSGDDNSEEDLYRAAEDIEQERQEKSQSRAAFSLPNSEEQSSVAAPESLLTYGRREWKGHTAKSRLIRKGYEAIAQSFESLRRVRGDNYCALRATLFQLLCQSRKVPEKLQDPEVVQWPKQMEPMQDLVDQWRFPFGSKDGDSRAVDRLERCLKLLKTRWQEVVACVNAADRECRCQQAFDGALEEYEMLEALKFLMLHTAVQLHCDMEKGSRVPEFCWLLFARDTSKCPRAFFTNHLRHVGFSGGLEQVEMFLLGYSLQQTIQVYRLYKTDSEEFVTYYPDDHRTEWPYLSLVTEDDRHYNVLVPKQAKPLSSRFDESGRPKWNRPSGSQAQKHVTCL